MAGGWAGRVRDERGSVTAELAVGLPVVALLVVAVLGVGAAGVQHMRCSEAARTAARAAALGEPDADVVAAARHVAGSDARVEVRRDGGWATVTVEDDLALVSFGGAVRVEGRATAWVEP